MSNSGWLSRLGTTFVVSLILSILMCVPNVNGQESKEPGSKQAQQEKEDLVRRRAEQRQLQKMDEKEQQRQKEREIEQAIRKKMQSLRREGRHEEAEAIARDFKMRQQAERKERQSAELKKVAAEKPPHAKDADARMEHLKQAIEHLRAAGMEDLAAHVKQQGGRILTGLPAHGTGPEMPPAPPQMPPPQMERIGQAFQQVHEAIANIDRRLHESQQLGQS